MKNLYATLQHVTIWLCSKFIRAGKYEEISSNKPAKLLIFQNIKMESFS